MIGLLLEIRFFHKSFLTLYECDATRIFHFQVVEKSAKTIWRVDSLVEPLVASQPRVSPTFSVRPVEASPFEAKFDTTV